MAITKIIIEDVGCPDDLNEHIGISVKLDGDPVTEKSKLTPGQKFSLELCRVADEFLEKISTRTEVEKWRK